MSDSFERLFFALWPSDVIRREIVAAYDKYPRIAKQGRRVRHSNLHMTLHFLGNIPVYQVPCFIKQAASVKGRPFELVLTRTGYFSRARVAWIGCEILPQALMDLHGQLGESIRRCGFEPESRAYNPHVTMARKIRAPLQSVVLGEIRWKIEGFVLLRSEIKDNAVRYRVRAKYPF